MKDSYINFLKSSPLLQGILLTAAFLCGCFVIVGAPRMEFSIDAPLMHYFAWQIIKGATPYVDIIDMNGPGTYLLHMLCVFVFGTSEFGWRIFDLMLMALGIFSAFGLYRNTVVAPTVGLALFFSWLISEPYDLIGQRDLWVCYLTIFVLFLLSSERIVVISKIASGIIVGFIISMKPQFGLFCLPVTISYLYFYNKHNKKIHRYGLFLSGIIASISVILFWLWLKGGLQYFINFNIEYNFIVYSHLQRLSVIELFDKLLFSSKVFLIPIMFIVSMRMLSTKPLGLIWALGCLGAIVCYLLQGKGWEYHQIPFIFFTSFFIGEQFRNYICFSPCKKFVSVVCIAGVVAFLKLQPRPVAVFDRPNDAHHHQQELVDFLVQAKRQNPQIKVQVLDTAEGAIRALLKANINNATPYIYDFMLFAKTEKPVVQSMQQDFMLALSRASPDYIVQSWLSWLPWDRAGFNRTQSFIELNEYLLKDYQIILQNKRYRIYLKKYR